MIKTAMILAAGRGERLRPLTDTMPKPLIEVAHKPLLIHLIEKLVRVGITRLVINVCYLAEQIQRYVGDGRLWGVEIIYTVETTALETGGGIANALPWLGNKPFMVVSADIFTDFDFATLPPQPLGLGHLVLVKSDLSQDFSLMPSGWLENTPCWTYANIAVFKPAFFQLSSMPARFKLVALLRPAIAQRQLTGEIHTGLWFNIGDHVTLSAAQKAGHTAIGRHH